MKIEKIKPIPKYIQKKIKLYDDKLKTAPFGRTRFYAYFTKNDGELVKVREVILYEDEIVITYNFTDSPERLKVNKEQILQEEKQIKRAKHSFSFNSGSTILAGSPPSRHTQKERIKLHRVCLFLCKTGVNCRFCGNLPFLLFLRSSP